MKSTNSQRTQHENGFTGTTEMVQQRAYELYMQRGQEAGHELEDWLQAEREVRQQQQKTQRVS